jgi:hypothetical protein
MYDKIFINPHQQLQPLDENSYYLYVDTGIDIFISDEPMHCCENTPKIHCYKSLMTHEPIRRYAYSMNPSCLLCRYSQCEFDSSRWCNCLMRPVMYTASCISDEPRMFVVQEFDGR